MRKIIILFTLLVSVYNTKAEGDIKIAAANGLMIKNTYNAIISLEFERKYHSSWEVYVDFSGRWLYEGDKIYTPSILVERTFGVGSAYKRVLARSKNVNFLWRVGGDLGIDEENFYASIDLATEIVWTLGNKWEVFLMQKNDFCFWTKRHFKNGVIIGIKLPLK